MRSRKQSHVLWLALCAGLGPLAPEAGAVVTINGWNTASFPEDQNNYSVGNYEGSFDGDYSGTPITSSMMLTVSHVFPGTTSSFYYNNGGATTTSYSVEVVATLDDLAAWEIAPNQGLSFANPAQIYTGTGETNPSTTIVDLGRGYSRGTPTTGGWLWGGSQGTLSWGENNVSAIPTDVQLNTGGGAFGGDFLQYDFNAGSSNSNECMISPFDSGGGVFIEVNGTYELAGVNSLFGVRIATGGTDYGYEVTDSMGNEIGATLDDTKNYYYLKGYTAQNQPVVAQITTDTPESSFATRVSSKQNFIGLVDGTISAAQAPSYPINDDGLLSVYQNLTTGAITGGAQVSIAPDGQATLKLAPNSGISEISSLAIASGSELDITNNEVLIDYKGETDPIASIVAWIKSGYAGGGWTGRGITSSTAQANSQSYGIGYADSADPGNPAGLPSDTIEIKYTLLGDANLDGVVNAEDFTPFSHNLNQNGGWDQGDFNYDGVVNAEDFTLFSHNLNQSATEFSGAASALAAADAFAAANGLDSNSGGPSSVLEENLPEPACGAMMVAAGLAVLRRRRRERSASIS